MDRKAEIPDEFLIPPGETIADVLKDRNMTEKALAMQAGCTEDAIHHVICGEMTISAELAKQLEKVFAVSASFWLHLQANYDEERLRDKK